MRANHKAACVVRGWFQVGTTLRTFVKLAVRSEAMNSTRKPQTQAVERIEARANEDGKKSPTTMPRGILYQIQFWKGGGNSTLKVYETILRSINLLCLSIICLLDII